MFGRSARKRKQQMARRIAVHLLDDHKVKELPGQRKAWHFLHENEELLWSNSSSRRLWLRRVKLSDGINPSDLWMNGVNLCHIRDGLLYDHRPFRRMTLGFKLYLGFMFFILGVQILNIIRMIVTPAS